MLQEKSSSSDDDDDDDAVNGRGKRDGAEQCKTEDDGGAGQGGGDAGGIEGCLDFVLRLASDERLPLRWSCPKL